MIDLSKPLQVTTAALDRSRPGGNIIVSHMTMTSKARKNVHIAPTQHNSLYNNSFYLVLVRTGTIGFGLCDFMGKAQNCDGISFHLPLPLSAYVLHIHVLVGFSNIGLLEMFAHAHRK